MSSNLDLMETQLELFTENVRQIGIIVTDFQPQGQTVLNQKMCGTFTRKRCYYTHCFFVLFNSNQMVQSLQEIDRLKNQIQDIQVPLEVFEYIDQGRNPQLYTKDCMEKALSKNEQVKGKIDSYRRFKAMLLVELSKVFPNEMAKYRAIRGDERTS
ncbi:Mediator of RNA polymerase II transcription subunit 10-like protein [Dinothrombium tinctorium]|uniref:Mediator of RNA polymerase II transcription subunit 10 n=1 Tax=Dinothrombium tinctorium TaxID=1965070 RepID=A0A443RL11_9ACAR|nr:Mediator of RNA polymerase II transcription subunit 10-like protein [Dinothrombium tinctorium]